MFFIEVRENAYFPISNNCSGSTTSVKFILSKNAYSLIDVNDDGNLMFFIEVRENAYFPIFNNCSGSTTSVKFILSENA